MAIPIPPEFDYRAEQIDPNEQMVRDAFQLNVDNWARFRHAIGVGTDPAHLQGSSISDALKDAYRELGKCHYEVVLSLGYCRLAMLEINLGNSFVGRKAVKDFYFHGGALLDNLARIIYIVNVRTAASEQTRRGEYLRHLVDRGKLLDNKYATEIKTYLPHINSSLIAEFSSTRNTMAHYWGIPFDNGQWPRDQLQDKAFAWPTHEPKYQTYSGWTPFQVILAEHFQELTKAQGAVFGLLVNDIAKFEVNNGVTIA